MPRDGMTSKQEHVETIPIQSQSMRTHLFIEHFIEFEAANAPLLKLVVRTVGEKLIPVLDAFALSPGGSSG